jgi:hypothetical protein
MGVLHQCAGRARGPFTDVLESTREFCSQSKPPIRLGRWPVGGTRIGWNRLCPHQFEGAIGFTLFTRPGIGGSYWAMFFPALVVLRLGIAISVAPLTTTVMNSVDQNHAGTASGVNNAISRIAALLAVAAFGALLTDVFQTALDRKLNYLGVSPAERIHVEAQRSGLAGADADDPLARQAINEAFVAGDRVVLWVAVGLALASSMSAALLIRAETKPARRAR